MQLLVSPGFCCTFVSFNLFPILFPFLYIYHCKTLNQVELTQSFLTRLPQFYYVIMKNLTRFKASYIYIYIYIWYYIYIIYIYIWYYIYIYMILYIYYIYNIYIIYIHTNTYIYVYVCISVYITWIHNVYIFILKINVTPANFKQDSWRPLKYLFHVTANISILLHLLSDAEIHHH